MSPRNFDTTHHFAGAWLIRRAFLVNLVGEQNISGGIIRLQSDMSVVCVPTNRFYCTSFSSFLLFYKGPPKFRCIGTEFSLMN